MSFSSSQDVTFVEYCFWVKRKVLIVYSKYYSYCFWLCRNLCYSINRDLLKLWPSNFFLCRATNHGMRYWKMDRAIFLLFHLKKWHGKTVGFFFFFELFFFWKNKNERFVHKKQKKSYVPATAYVILPNSNYKIPHVWLAKICLWIDMFLQILFFLVLNPWIKLWQVALSFII